MRVSRTSARQWARLALGRSQPIDDGQRRYVRIMQTGVAALAGRGIALVVSIITVPLTLGYLGSERYGMWITMSTLLTWFQLADIGLGNGLTNAVSDAYGKGQNKLAQRHVANAFWLLSAIATALGVLAAVAWLVVDWAAFFNVLSPLAQAEAAPMVGAALLVTLVGLPFSIVEKVYGAYQEGFVVGIWQIAGSLASLFAILVVTYLQAGLVWLVVAYSGTLLAVKIISAVVLFKFHKPWLVPVRHTLRYDDMRRLSTVGVAFFVVQIAALLNVQTDNVIIAHFLGAAAVTPYSITWRLFAYTLMLQLLVFPALWPAYAEAFARNDGRWIRRAFARNMIGGTLLTAVFALLLVAFGAEVIELWAGPAAVPPRDVLVWMGVWSVLSAAMSAIACVLNGAGQLKGQMIYGLLTAAANVALSILLVGSLGISGVIIATVLAYAIFNTIPASIETYYVLTRRAQA